MRNRLSMGSGSRRGLSPRRTAARGLSAALLAMGMVVAGSELPASGATADAWPVTYGDAGNSTNNPAETVIRVGNAASLRTAWVSSGPGTDVWAPPVAAGVAYRLLQGSGGAWSLAAISGRTGSTLWTAGLPVGESYNQALVLAGNTVVVPFWGQGRAPGGLSAVDLSTHRVRWTRYLPPSSIPSASDTVISNPTTDGTRVFVTGSSNEVTTYRVSDGSLLWTAPMTPNSRGGYNEVDAMAERGGVLYTTGDEGLIARDAATGDRLWTAAAGGRPVVAGGRVFAFHGADVVAFAAGGCGGPTCAPLWRTALPDAPEHAIGGADARTLFVTVHPMKVGYVARLSAVTGKVQWTASIGTYMTGLVRGGNTIWLYAEYREHGTDHNHILGFSTTATSSRPLRTITLANTNYEWFPQQLAITGGTLFEQPNGPQLVGYRIPGT